MCAIKKLPLMVQQVQGLLWTTPNAITENWSRCNWNNGCSALFSLWTARGMAKYKGNGGHLTRERPYGSGSSHTFCRRFIQHIPRILHTGLWYMHLVGEDSYRTVYMTDDQISNKRWELHSNKKIWEDSYCLLIPTNSILRGGQGTTLGYRQTHTWNIKYT